jgi:hypothetical protein
MRELSRHKSIVVIMTIGVFLVVGVTQTTPVFAHHRVDHLLPTNENAIAAHERICEKALDKLEINPQRSLPVFCEDTSGGTIVDTDLDGIPDSSDPCPLDATNTCQTDSDLDGIPDITDPCPTDPLNTCI